MVNGNNIFIALDTSSAPFAATKANKIKVGCQKIPISSPDTGDWEKHVVGRKNWSFSIASLVSNVTDIKKVLMVGQSYTVYVCSRSGNNITVQLQGTATCMQAEFDMTQGSICHGSFSFDGNGPLSDSSPVSSSNL